MARLETEEAENKVADSHFVEQVRAAQAAAAALALPGPEHFAQSGGQPAESDIVRLNSQERKPT